MASLVKQLYEASLDLELQLDDGETSQPFDPHVDQQLAALGYLAASDPEEERELLKGLPRALREPLKKPFQAPDTAPLVEADRRAHQLRLAIVESRARPEDARDAIAECGDLYVAWLAEHPDQIRRVAWRVQALMELAGELDLTVDAKRWSEMLLQATRAARDPGGEPPR
jgi:hypothetical protein